MKRWAYEDLPLEAISTASRAAAERQGMGALHVGSHVLLALLNEGIVVLVSPLPEGVVGPTGFACYECGGVVVEGTGERHGRAGWVHFTCIPAE